MDSTPPKVKSKQLISLVVPAYNEARRIEHSLKEIKSFFDAFPMNVEILLVIEKSTDNTVALATQLVGTDPRFRIIANSVQKGKGYAVKTGMLQAKGEIVFFMDVDLSTPLVEVVKFVNHFADHPDCDVVIGSRQHQKSEVIKKQNPLRQKMGQTFNLLVQFFAIKGITDTQCGFKAFAKKCVQPVFSNQSLDGFSFDVEILIIAQKLGYKIDVVPVKWINSPESKVRIVRDSLKMLLDIMRVRRRVNRNLRRSGTQVT